MSKHKKYKHSHDVMYNADEDCDHGITYVQSLQLIEEISHLPILVGAFPKYSNKPGELAGELVKKVRTLVKETDRPCTKEEMERGNAQLYSKYSECRLWIAGVPQPVRMKHLAVRDEPIDFQSVLASRNFDTRVVYHDKSLYITDISLNDLIETGKCYVYTKPVYLNSNKAIIDRGELLRIDLKDDIENEEIRKVRKLEETALWNIKNGGNYGIWG